MVTHPLPPFASGRTVVTVSRDGYTTLQSLSQDRYLPEFLRWLLHLTVSFVTIARMRKKFDIYIGADSVNAVTGLLLKLFMRVDSVVYFAHSLPSRRYQNTVTNSVYHLLDRICTDHATVLWSLSSRLAQARSKAGVSNKRNIYVPIGVQESFMMTKRPEARNRSNLVFVGSLTKEKGVDLAIRGMPSVLKRAPAAHLIIVGSGPEEAYLRHLTEELGLVKHVTFAGKMTHQQVLPVLEQSGVGLAVYSMSRESSLWTTEPTKPKEYIAAGLPVVTTRIVEYADLIESTGAGLVINFEVGEFANAIVTLVTDENAYSRCQEGAKRLAENFAWGKILDELFATTLACLREN